MARSPRQLLLLAALSVNVIAAAIYVAWLATAADGPVLFTRDGVFAVLPVVPLVFGFIWTLSQ